ncbi:MAG: HupE/UreJ family protein [Gemmatimonadota bacterium]
MLVVPGSTSPLAHEIPRSATVLAFVKADGNTLHVLVRVPLTSMRDVTFPTRPLGYLDLPGTTPLLQNLVQQWIVDYVEFYANDSLVGPPHIAATRVSLPSDRSFASFETALGNFAAPSLSPDIDLPPEQALLDVWLQYSIPSPNAKFAVRPAFAHLGLSTNTVLRFVTPNGSERPYQYSGDPGLVRLDPAWYHAALNFVRLGFTHILDGIDHLLFLLGLVIPFRRVRPLIAIITSFTVAHSITLIASALGYAPTALWFPPLIEALIALSIVYMAFENIIGARFQRRWIIAFAFGLVHGFGFSFALRDSMQFAGGHLLTALLSFNVGVELGQLLVVTVAVPALSLVFRKVVDEKVGTIILSALVAHTAWHWMTERFGVVREYEIGWPVLDLAFLATVLRGLMVLLLLGAALWGLSILVRRITVPSGTDAAMER